MIGIHQLTIVDHPLIFLGFLWLDFFGCVTPRPLKRARLGLALIGWIGFGVKKTKRPLRPVDRRGAASFGSASFTLASARTTIGPLIAACPRDLTSATAKSHWGL